MLTPRSRVLTAQLIAAMSPAVAAADADVLAGAAVDMIASILGNLVR